jgi:hypothetical protein
MAEKGIRCRKCRIHADGIIFPPSDHPVTMQESKPPSNPLDPKHPYYPLFCTLAKVSREKPRKKSAKNLFAERYDEQIKQDRDAMDNRHRVNSWQQARDAAWDELSANAKRDWETTSVRKHEESMAEYQRLKDSLWPDTPENRQRYVSAASTTFLTVTNHGLDVS